MKKNVIISSVLFVAVFIFASILFYKNENLKIEEEANNNQTSSGIILFYGDGCPHCKIVEEFIMQSQADKKIAITQKEVYRNSDNSAELGVKAEACGLATDSIGVPFLWDGEGKCYIGDQDIIEFLKQKIE